MAQQMEQRAVLPLDIIDLFYFIHVSTRGPPRISPKVSEVSSPLILTTYSTYCIISIL